MFSLLDQVVLRLLPVRHPEQLVIVRERATITAIVTAQHRFWPMFEDLRDNNHVFRVCSAVSSHCSPSYGDRSAQISAELVSGSYFETLGIGAALGRTLLPTMTPFRQQAGGGA